MNKEKTKDGVNIDALDENAFRQYLTNFESKLKTLFHEDNDINKISITRGLPAPIISTLKEFNPLSMGISSAYGGKSGTVRQNLAMMTAASYESLALSLAYGINWALFLQPFIKYGEEPAKKKVLSDFVLNRRLGGLMITEPEYGSDALRMQTSFTKEPNHYHIKGMKHWAGLTGHADYWLLTARQKSSDGNLMRDIDFFVSDNNAPEQRIIVEEYYENLGLYMLPYGLNRVDVKIPIGYKLVPTQSGVSMMLDTLHRSRMEFTGMGMGFIKRMLDEALIHTDGRLIGGKKLNTYDQVQFRLSKMQSNYTVCSAMITHVSQRSDISNDLAPHSIEANSIKSVLSDMMQESAQYLLQLVGGKGYRLNHIAGRAIVDSRPFQIFEGSNDILYNQISEAFIKNMKAVSLRNFGDYLTSFELTQKAADFVKKFTNFEIGTSMSQRKMVDLGKVIGRIVSMNLLVTLSEKSFRADLINNAIEILTEEINTLIHSYRYNCSVVAVNYYHENSNWVDL